MRVWKRLAGLAALGAALTSCGAAEGEDGGGAAAPSAAAEGAAQTARPEVVRPRAPHPHRYSVLDSASVDVDGDGTAERVELAATVELDARGRPLWEDGHQWLVLVRDGEATYPLVEEFVPWGGAAFWILRDEEGGPPTVLVETRSRLGERVGVTVASYRFDAGRGGFARRGEVRESGEVLHGDPGALPVLVSGDPPRGP